MGHIYSSDNTQYTIELFHGELIRQVRDISEIAHLTYRDLLAFLLDINKLSYGCMDSEGNQLLFLIKKGSDVGTLWKNRIQIACLQFHTDTQMMNKKRLLNLNQFLKVYRSLKLLFDAAESTNIEQGQEATANSANSLINTSVLINDIDRTVGSISECCICFERQQEIMLPCLHSFCQLCIQNWNHNNKTCPICREKVGNDKDSWVIFDAPNGLEIGEVLVSSLMNILDADWDVR